MFNSEALQSVMESVLGPLQKNLSSDDELLSVTGWDSMAALRIMLAIEQQHRIKLPVKDFVQARSVADLLMMVQQAK